MDKKPNNLTVGLVLAVVALLGMWFVLVINKKYIERDAQVANIQMIVPTSTLEDIAYDQAKYATKNALSIFEIEQCGRVHGDSLRILFIESILYKELGVKTPHVDGVGMNYFKYMCNNSNIKDCPVCELLNAGFGDDWGQVATPILD